MSNAREGDEEDEEFYESLDRILSSSCSSTSASDEDADYQRRRVHGRGVGFPRFPIPSAASYDEWISGTSSVEERRRRLLQQMGLADDSALARRRSAPPVFGGAVSTTPPLQEDIGGSASYDAACARPKSPPEDPSIDAHGFPDIVRSRSECFVDPPSLLNLSREEASEPPVPPRREHGDLCDDGVNGSDPRLMIKNLDDGREFVVREDGTWGKVKEVGTGRQLTMEEFDMCVGRSPIVQELMRRQKVAQSKNDSLAGAGDIPNSRSSGGIKYKKKGSWLRGFKNVAVSSWNPRKNFEKDNYPEKGGQRPSSATEGSIEGPRHFPERIKVRHYGKNHKELTALYLTQEIRAHSGSIWSIKFSLDGRFLASAGEDCVIYVWQVTECQKEELLLEHGLEKFRGSNSLFSSMNPTEHAISLACMDVNHLEMRRASSTNCRKLVGSDHVMVPDNIFSFSEKPICSFKGHNADVLDLSWSKSQYLLSSSMDKTVRLWHMSSKSCLKTFCHSDYVTCIQFNPVDDRYFISGSLDEKVRLWSIPDRQVVDWSDIHEMVTAACYTPDGQGALVGSYKGSCLLYDTSGNKLQLKSPVDLQNKKKRSSNKKVTGFQFGPMSSSEVLITSADSRIRVIDGSEVVHKFKGFKNTSSQISASMSTNGRYVVCASEDSQVYFWRYDTDSRPSGPKGVAATTTAYEQFHCPNITAAVTWPGSLYIKSQNIDDADGGWKPNLQALMEAGDLYGSLSLSHRCFSERSLANGDPDRLFADRVSATWPEEKLAEISGGAQGPKSSSTLCRGASLIHNRTAWGLAIITAGRGGEIKAFQNFGFLFDKYKFAASPV